MPQITWDQNFLGTIVLPLLAVIVAIAIYLLQRSRRRLSYQIVSVEPVPPSEHGQPQTDWWVRVEFRNTGNQPLSKEDFRTPISTQFIDAESVVSAEPSPSPLSIHADVTAGGRTGYLHPDLLNPYDVTYAQYRVRGFKRKIYVGGRIVGISHIGNLKIGRFMQERVSMLLVFFVGYLMAEIRDNREFEVYWFVVIAFPFVLLSIFQFVALLRDQCSLFFSFEVQPS